MSNVVKCLGLLFTDDLGRSSNYSNLWLKFIGFIGLFGAMPLSFRVYVVPFTV